MPFQLFDQILASNWIALVVIGGLLLLSTELGFRIGNRHSPERRKVRKELSGSLQGALLGLLGLLLGFTFAMAVGRYETRKELVLDEANAIGTTWLRAGMLSDSARDVIRAQLVDYVDARLAGVDQSIGTPAFNQQAARSEADQVTLWRTIVEETKLRDTPSAALFTASLNDVIDLDAKRQAASRNHVPQSVWLLLLVVSMTVTAVTGYTTGLGESGRQLLSMFVLPLLFTVVIVIISDLDHPRRGLITVSQQSMLDLQRLLQKY